MAFTSDTLRRFSSSLRGGGGASGGVGNFAGEDETLAASAISEMGQVTTRYLHMQEARRKGLENRQAVSSAVLGQQDFHYSFSKELSKVYRSDGVFAPPAKDYKFDLGWGIQLVRDDFYREGRKVQPTEIFRRKSAEYLNRRKAKAPTLTAANEMEMRLRQQEMRQRLAIDEGQNAWALKSVGNATNQVVRSFKEQISRIKGHSPAVFAEHLRAMGDVIAPAMDYADQGAVMNTMRMGITDLISAGVVESSTNRDNDFALRVLGNSHIRNAATVRNAMAGLSPADRAWYGKMINLYARGRKTFPKGAAIPADYDQQLDWALGQVAPMDLEKIHMKAVQGFKAQTDVVRTGLKARLRGVLLSATQDNFSDSGFREQVKQSVVQGMRETNRLFPKAYYPVENSELSAGFLAASELMDMRKAFDNAPTFLLPQIASQMQQVVAGKIQNKLGPQNYPLAFQVNQMVNKGLQAKVSQIVKRRDSDPLGAILSENKSLARQYSRLNSPKTQYRDAAERARDQDFFRVGLMRDGIAKGIVPDFLSMTDKATISNLGSLGAYNEVFQAMHSLRQRYGDVAYFDNILPTLAKLEGVGAYARPLAFLRNPSAATYFLKARDQVKQWGNETKNNSDVKDFLSKRVSEYDPHTWETLRSTVEGRLGRNADSTAVMLDIEKMVQDAVIVKLMQHELDDFYKNNILWFDEDKELSENYGLWGRKVGVVPEVLNYFISGMSGQLRADIIDFDGRSMIRPAKLTLSQPYLEVLESNLRNDQFLMEKVTPFIQVNRHYMETANRLGMTPANLFLRDFKDDENVSWEFSEEGLRPMKRIEELGGIDSVMIDNRSGLPFTFLYSDLPELSVGTW